MMLEWRSSVGVVAAAAAAIVVKEDEVLKPEPMKPGSSLVR